MQPLFTTDEGGERSGMGFTVMESFMDSLEDIGNGVVDFTVFILANAPYILLIAVGVVVVVVVAKRSIRKKKAKKSENSQN